MRIVFTALLVCSALSLLNGCKGIKSEDTDALTLNEVVSSNDGVNIDESGQTEDWLELANTSATALNLSDYDIADSSGEYVALPNITLNAGQVLLFWADKDTKDGNRHLPFKISASGDTLKLKNRITAAVQEFVIPPLETNQSYSRFPSATGKFTLCRYATPNKDNGKVCAPSAAPVVTDSIQFKDFPLSQWPSITPATIGMNELALFPAEFIEFKNFSSQTQQLNQYRLVLAPYPPTSGLPSYDSANAIDLPNVALPSSGLYTLALNENMMAKIRNQEFHEGVAVLFSKSTRKPVDTVPFMHWPEGKPLARAIQPPYRFSFCQTSTPDANNNCAILPSRAIGNRTRGIYTPGDFAALAQGGGETNIQSVKFLIDIKNDNAIHFPNTRDWALHYTFVREVIDLDPPLNRCDAFENNEFNQGWGTFSFENYSNTVTRRYHLGTVTKHPNAGLQNVEFTFGDEITAVQMRDAFYKVTSSLPDPQAWTLRPQDATQVSRVRAIEGTLPIVGPNAPFKNLIYQGLAPGVAYGTLTYIATDALADSTLGERIIVITNDVPNDIDFVAGLITEAFQTPLAHVNILSQSRNTPNMALPGASQNSAIRPLLGKLVRLEVNEGGYTLRQAELAEAQAFWAQQTNQSPPLNPRLDRQTSQFVDLLNASIDNIPSIGAKASQLAELFKINQNRSVCSEGANFALPEGAFAIPMYHYLQHMQKSGAQKYVDELLQDDLFLTDTAYRKLSLQALQQMITQYPVDAALLKQVETWVADRFGNKRVRFRSSSNTEDLEEFNGAGLYNSLSAELGDPTRPVDTAIKTVWASLWNARAVEERLYGNVNQANVAMAVLVHKAFTNERANGVAVARNLFATTRVDQYYFNSQAGEASVTNPAPGVVTEELIYQWPPRTPTLNYQSFSNLLEDKRVLTAKEVRALACAMDVVQNHFAQLLDPKQENRWFTMESEFKFLGAERTLLLKQARPYKISGVDIPNDCREQL